MSRKSSSQNLVGNAAPHVVESVLRNDIHAYVDKAMFSLLGREGYLPNWHIEHMAAILEGFLYGGDSRIIYNSAPRMGKTLVMEVIAAVHALTMNPKLRIMKLCYSQELAHRDHNLARTLIKRPWNRKLNPDLQFADGNRSDRHLRDSSRIIETTEGGYILSSTIHGPNTGEGCDILIIGDPLNAANAMSDVERNKTNEVYDTALSTRVNSKHAKTLVSMQRLHLTDLSGHLLAKGGWSHYVVPAIAEEDQTYDLGGGRVHHRKKGSVIDQRRFDLAYYERQRNDMGSRAFAAQMQQRPELPNGVIFKREMLRFVDKLPVFDRVLVSGDLASSEGRGDYTVFCVWGISDRKWYLTHIYAGQMEFMRGVNLACKIDAEHEPELIVVESNNTGAAFQSAMWDRGYKNVDVAVMSASKVVRADHVTAVLEREEVMLWRKIPDLDYYLAQLLAFPSVRHDDFVDAFTLPLHRKNDALRVAYQTKRHRRRDGDQGPPHSGIYSLSLFGSRSRDASWLNNARLTGRIYI